MGKTSSGAIDRYSSTLKILKTKRPYDLLFQDEDEGVEEDGDGASVCSQRGDDSWLDPHPQSTIIIYHKK